MTSYTDFFVDSFNIHRLRRGRDHPLRAGPAPRRRFAVRQWPGNEADLNFVGVIARANAVLLVSQSLAEVAALDFEDCAAGRAVVPEAVGRIVAFKRVRPGRRRRPFPRATSRHPSFRPGAVAPPSGNPHPVRGGDRWP